MGQEYSRDCMLERNRRLVDQVSILLAVYDGTYRSGIGITVRYTQKLGREIIIINQVSRWVEQWLSARFVML